MITLKKWLHAITIWLSRLLSGLMPDRVPVTFVGDGSSRELCEAIAQVGVRRLLVVTDAMLVRVGVVERITRALDEVGVAWSLYDGIEPDPTTVHVAAGLARYRQDGCDAILAVGGGSPIDAAKAIAALVTNDTPLARLEGWLRVRRAVAPLFAIPTTAGTGSEATIAAVVSDPETHTKRFIVDPKLLPRMAALDPALMVGLPPAVTAATGMDALTHAVEAYLGRTATAATDAWAAAAVRLIFANLRTAHRDGADRRARKAMALAAYFAGLAFTRTSVGYVHAIAHTFGARYGTPHGFANAIALPRVLEFSLPAARRRLADLGAMIGIDAASEEERARGFIASVEALERDVGIPPTLDALERDDIPAIAAQALAEAHLNYPVPRYMTQPECEDLLRRMVA